MAEAQVNGAAATAPAAAPPSSAAPAAPPVAAGDDKGDNWRFIPPQSVREDQVQNAVNFLSHPKVKNSPVVYRRSFLERKGLTREEIDEAFRRVPDPPSTTSAAPVPAAPTAGPVTAVALPAQTAAVAVVPRKGARWTQVVLAIGVLSAAGAGAAVVTKTYLFPRMKAWLRRIVLDEESSEQKKSRLDVEASKASAALTAATTEMAALVRELVSSRHEERRYFDTVVKSMEAQTREIKLRLDTLIQLQKKGNITSSETNVYKAQVPRDAKDSTGVAFEPARPSSAPYSFDPDRFAPSAKYSEILAMVERGEKPPGIRDVNDKPPNPTQPASNSMLQPKTKPWESHVPSENGASAQPWWRQRDGDAKITENSVKIVEMEDQDTVSSDGAFSASPQIETAGRAWVPPPVPKTILPGVDAAIRHKSPSPVSYPSYDNVHSNGTSTDNAEGSSSSEIRESTSEVTVEEAE
ncbi:peroxisomal membrane protein PEX14-like [Selaginella moellendorffii]|uniref:peroxisomal membrane protein PEX14-like n=1 Tax=Selaginella moellendorffii TaxID=88036 RepID=UPI000D1C241A|nr:peroxisomal membrane protein PEX14-like [Selaginella moellendorffii]|eukprot:XP_024544987.1 peroxisomal membrane protein PEX14-like [Selaginella moellendorffii]